MNKKLMGILLVVLVIAVSVIGRRFINSVDDKQMEKEMTDDSMMTVSENNDGNMKKDEQKMTKDVEDKEMIEKEVALMNEGPMAPEFSLIDLEANTISLKDLKGEKVYVKFWASWCPICLSALEEIDTLSGEDIDFTVLTIVAPGYNGELNQEDFKEWFKTRDTNNMKVLLDIDGNITKTYGVRGYPTSVFIGSDGVVVGHLPGHIGSEQIKDIFKEIK